MHPFTSLRPSTRPRLSVHSYVLLEDSLRFSETGAAFFTDFMSKHAMHAACAERVVCAGEFVVLPSGAAGAYTLFLDNNSGTYAPPASLLPALRDLFAFNFPGLDVQYIDAADPQLKALHARVPSRLKQQ